MSYPPVRQLGPGIQRGEARQARRIALSARRRQELELQRRPASLRHSEPMREDGHARPGRSYPVAVAAVVLTLVIAVAVATNAWLF